MIPSLLLIAALAASDLAPDLHPHSCHYCEAWNAPQAPFHIHGTTYYVGPRGLSVVLIATEEGLILLDGALPQSVPMIAENLASLGYDINNVRWILNSHAHFDHAAGIAALARLSGARVAASPLAAQALQHGNVPADDPQAGEGEEAMRFPPVAEIVAVQDGETITLGGIEVTAHFTPGHTPGGTTWTWRSCEGKQCLSVVYADSLTAVSSQGFRFSDDPARVEAFNRSIDKVAALPCDVLISPHPEASGLFERQQRAASDRTAFIDIAACKRYADNARQRLHKRLAEEAAVEADHAH